jgi:hypothetical protein
VAVISHCLALVKHTNKLIIIIAITTALKFLSVLSVSENSHNRAKRVIKTRHKTDKHVLAPFNYSCTVTLRQTHFRATTINEPRMSSSHIQTRSRV